MNSYKPFKVAPAAGSVPPLVEPAANSEWGRQQICPKCNRGATYSCICDPFFDDGDSAAEHRVAESLRQIDWCRQGRGKPDGFERVEL